MRGQSISPIGALIYCGRERYAYGVPVWTDEPEPGTDGEFRLSLHVGSGGCELTAGQAEELISQLEKRVAQAEEMAEDARIDPLSRAQAAGLAAVEKAMEAKS